MKKIIRTILLGASLIGISLSFSKCVEYPENDWVRIVTDLKEIKESWYLEYDYKGRLVQYGETPIQYAKNKIVVGEMDWISKKEKLLEATYYLSKGRIVRCISKNMIDIDSIRMEVTKQVYYRWKEDTLFMDTQFFRVGDNRLLRTANACYIYDKQYRLTDIMSQYTDSKGKESACHSYFYYDSNLYYTSNLDMQAFYADSEGLDTYFFFLLDMKCKKENRALPNYIRHCVNHGKATYVAEALYRMEGEQPVHMEIISDEIKLKSRFDFSYYKD